MAVVKVERSSAGMTVVPVAVGGTPADADVRAARGLAGHRERLGGRGVQEVERRAARQLDRRARVMGEDEGRGVERRVMSDHNDGSACRVVVIPIVGAAERTGLHFIPPGQPWRNGYTESFN
jgi:hypothetical protein